MKKTGLTVSDLIESIPVVRERSGGVFPYKKEVCRCCFCNYCHQGKCVLKQCCCMEERIKACSCTFAEVLHHCFTNVGDNVFHFRLRLAIERANETKSIFLDREHKENFRFATSVITRHDNNFLAQLYLLTASKELWHIVSKSICSDGVIYDDVSLAGPSINDYTLFNIAADMEYGSEHAEMEDLTNDEIVDFDVFRTVCHAITIAAYGMDAVRVAERKPKRRKHRRRSGVVEHE